MKTVKSILAMFILMYCSTETLISQWSQIGLATDRVMSLGVKSNGNIFAGTYSNGLYRSTNNGSNWTQVLGPTSVYNVLSIAFDSSNGVLAGTYLAGLYRSTNNGTDWTLLSSDTGPNNLPVDDIYSVAVNPTGSIFAIDGATNIGWVYRSTDLGTTWQTVLARSGGLVEVSINSSGTVYTGGGDWFNYSTNNGDNWTWKGSASGLTGAPLKLAAGSSGLLFAGTSGSGIFQSTNNWENWTALNTNLSNKYITALLLNDTILIAGTDGGGVFVSNNGGNWTAVNSGLTELRVRSLAISGTNLLIGTYGSGVWGRPLSELITGVEDEHQTNPNKYILNQNFPNPFNPSTMISLSLPKRSFVSLKVFDVTGKEVATLMNEELSAGNHSRQWNASAMPSGVYFCRVHAGGFVDTKKIVLIK